MLTQQDLRTLVGILAYLEAAVGFSDPAARLQCLDALSARVQRDEGVGTDGEVIQVLQRLNAAARHQLGERY